MEERKVGIDFLKIFAAFLVIVNHISYNGGLYTSTSNLLQAFIVTILQIISVVCVNIYALATGYLKYKDDKVEKYNFKKLIYLWIEIVFYVSIIYIILSLFNLIEFNKFEILNICLPLTMNQFWYFTAYFGLFFLMPIINKFVKNSSNNFIIHTIFSIFIFFSLYSSLTNFYFKDILLLNRGYSIWWLSFVYLIGAFIKKINLNEKVNKKNILKIYIFVNLLMYLVDIYVNQINKRVIVTRLFWGSFIDYNSFLVIISSICLFLLFIDVKPNKKISNILKYTSTASFGIYIIQLHPYIWNFIQDRFIFILDYNIFLEPIFVLSISIIIFIVLLLIDKFREYIFRILMIDRICESLSNLINIISNKIMLNFKNYILIKK